MIYYITNKVANYCCPACVLYGVLSPLSLDGVELFYSHHFVQPPRFSVAAFFVHFLGGGIKKPQTWWFAVEALCELLIQLPKITINRDGNAQNNRGVDDVPLVDTRADFSALCRAD